MKLINQAFRFVVRSGAVSAFAIVTIAIGIAATSTVFALVDRVLLQPLPYPQPDRLISLWESEPDVAWAPATLADVLAWKHRSTTLQDISAYQSENVTLTGIEQARRLFAAGVTPEFFTTAGVAPLTGSTSGLRDLTRVVISEALWKEVYHGDRTVVGRTIVLDRKAYVVAAVMGRKFSLPYTGVDVWVPFLLTAEHPSPDLHYLRVFARLRAGSTIGQARAEMSTISNQLQKQQPATNTGVQARVVPLKQLVNEQTGPMLRLLSYASACLLFIACVNLGSLLLAQNTMRQGEFAVRAALGANRLVLLRQLMVECALLVAVGGALGFALTPGALQAFLAVLPPRVVDAVPTLQEVSLSLRTLVFAFLAALVAALVSGTVPALIVSKRDISQTLQLHARSISWGKAQRLASVALMIVESALAVMLISGAAVLTRHFVALQTASPGFDPQNVIAARVTLPEEAYPSQTSQARFFATLFEKASTYPSLDRMALIDNLPLGGTNYDADLLMPGSPPGPAAKKIDAQYSVASAEYFKTMRIPLLAGRYFTSHDSASSSPVVIINEKLAAKYWPDRSPLGSRIRTLEPNAPWREIVGVVKSVRWHEYENEPVTPYYLYAPYFQDPHRAMYIVMRTPQQTAALSALRHVLAQIDNNVALSSASSMDSRIASANAASLFCTAVVCAFALFSLILAAGGVYGTIAFSLTRRKGEFAIRMALGATAKAVRKTVVVEVLKISLVGAAIGLALAPFLSVVASALIYDLPRISLWQALGTVATVLAFIAVATWLSAMRVLNPNFIPLKGDSLKG
jgi:putative ABC transport system permease protein